MSPSPLERFDQTRVFAHAGSANLNGAKAAATKTEIILKEKETRLNQLERELAGLKKTHEDTQSKLTTEQQQFSARAQRSASGVVTQIMRSPLRRNFRHYRRSCASM